MHVTEHLERASRPLFSFEIIPPKRGGSINDIFRIVEQIAPLNPPFIDVTSHAAEATYDELPDGRIIRRVRRKRPGTLSICGIIQNRWKIDTVPHLLCAGFTREETEDAIIELNYLGIRNVLAIRGDTPNYVSRKDSYRTRNLFASELVSQLNELRKGRYLENPDESEPIDMCVGVAGYPEKHYEAPNIKTDIQRLKEKVEAGAGYIVSQLFYDNEVFHNFTDNCRKAGISVPIIPGLKIINSPEHLVKIPRNFHVSIPEELSDEIEANPGHAREIGFRWALAQAEDLLARKITCIHFYVMNDAKPVLNLIKKLD